MSNQTPEPKKDEHVGMAVMMILGLLLGFLVVGPLLIAGHPVWAIVVFVLYLVLAVAAG